MGLVERSLPVFSDTPVHLSTMLTELVESTKNLCDTTRRSPEMKQWRPGGAPGCVSPMIPLAGSLLDCQWQWRQTQDTLTVNDAPWLDTLTVHDEDLSSRHIVCRFAEQDSHAVCEITHIWQNLFVTWRRLRYEHGVTCHALVGILIGTSAKEQLAHRKSC